MESSVHDWLSQCTLPDRTELQEHTLKTTRSIVIGDRCKIDYGLSGSDIIVCELCTINGNVVADGDVRIDNWCNVNGDVITGQDAYLGEGVKIHGRLIVRGDLDIGDNVQIDKGFEAKGWISIRNPLPVIVYVMLYLVTMLGLDKEDEIDTFIDELFAEEEIDPASEKEDCDEKNVPLLIPSSSVLNMETFSVPRSMAIGSSCRLHGNIRAGAIAVLEDNTIFGSLKADDSISIREGTAVHGDISAVGAVLISQGVHILGDVRCGHLTMHEDARIDGMIRAPQGVRIERVV